jgi:hypothetical protein
LRRRSEPQEKHSPDESETNANRERPAQQNASDTKDFPVGFFICPVDFETPVWED